MTLRKLLRVIPLISLVCLADISGQPRPRYRRPSNIRPEKAATERKTVELLLRYEFSAPGETSRTDFVVSIPRTMPGRQRILGVKYSPRPSKVFHKNGNRYAEFNFDEPEKQFQVEAKIKAELFRYDLSTAREKRQKSLSKGPDFDDFLKQEEFVEKDNPVIQQIAEGIEGESEIETVKKIYDYVIDNMDYSIPGKRALGAVKAAQEKKGDCSEYSDLFVALCRAKKIPARVVTGYTVRFDDVSPKHHWAEVYLQEYGWVPFEPSWGDVEDARIRNTMFSTMKPAYIYLTHTRNDEVLYNNHFYTFFFWGDKVALKDSIEFKQPGEGRANERQ